MSKKVFAVLAGTLLLGACTASTNVDTETDLLDDESMMDDSLTDESMMIDESSSSSEDELLEDDASSSSDDAMGIEVEGETEIEADTTL